MITGKINGGKKLKFKLMEKIMVTVSEKTLKKMIESQGNTLIKRHKTEYSELDAVITEKKSNPNKYKKFVFCVEKTNK